MDLSETSSASDVLGPAHYAALKLAARSELLLELSAVLPKLFEQTDVRVALSRWMRCQIDELKTESYLVEMELDDELDGGDS